MPRNPYDFEGPTDNQSDYSYDFMGPVNEQYDFSMLPDPPGTADDKSLLERWNESWVNQPLLDKWRRGSVIPGAGERVIDPQRRAREIDPVEGRNDSQWRMPEWIPGIGGGTYRSLVAGTAEGLGEFARMSSTPLNLGTIGAFEGEGLAAKYGLGIPAEYLGLTGRALSAPVAGQGATDIYEGIRTGDYGRAARGIPTLAGGAAGMFGPGHAPVGLRKVADQGVPRPPTAPPSVEVPSVEGRGSNVPEGWLPFGQLPEGQYTSPTPFFQAPESQSGLPFGEPTQEPLNLGAYRSPAGRFATSGPAAQPRVRPFLEEPLQQHMDYGDFPYNDQPVKLTAGFDQPQSPVTRQVVDTPPLINTPTVAEAAPTVEPTAPVLESGVEVVNGQERVTRRNWNDAMFEYWKKRGFVPGGLTSDGQIYMVRGTTTPAVVREPITPQEQATRGAVSRNEIPIDKNEVTIPSEQATDKTVAFLKTKGLELVSEENGQSTFRRASTSLLGNERGSVNIDLITVGLRRLLGREPTVAEIHEEVRAAEPSEELSDTALVRRTRATDVNVINSNVDHARAVELRDFWRRELDSENRAGDTDAQKHAQNMLNRATVRERFLQDNAPEVHEPVRESTYPEPISPSRRTNINREADIQEIADVTNISEAGNIGTRWHDVFMDHSNPQDLRNHALEMSRRAHNRVYEYANQTLTGANQFPINDPLTGRPSSTTPSSTPPSGWQSIEGDTPPTHAPGATQLGGTPPAPRIENPPVTFGLQEYNPRGKRGITQAEYDRLRGSVSEAQVAAEEAKRARDPVTGKRLKRVNDDPHDTWEGWANSQIASDTADGPPGLSIEDGKMFSFQDPTYKIIYRDPEGKVVGYVKVREKPSGERVVPIWAIDKTRAPVLVGRAFDATTQAMLKMNAAAASGGISHNTARVIAMAKRLIRSETGSANIDLLTLGLSNLLDRIRNGVGERTKTNIPEDMLHNAGVTEEPLRRFMSETGALRLPNGEQLKKIPGMIKGAVQGFFKEGPNKEPSTFQEAMALPGAAMTTGDVSMPLRQGFSQIFTPEWWKALKPMFQAGFSAEKAAAIDAEIRSNPIHQTKYDVVSGKEIPSMAKQMGVTLIEDGKITKSEYSIGSNWIENGGNIPGISKVYRESVGKYITKPSNRAAATFLNHLRTFATEKLLNSARDMAIEATTTGRAPYPGVMGGMKLPEMMGGKRIGFTREYTTEQAGELNPYNNMKLAREIGDFVNTATGRAPLRTTIIPVEGVPELSLERAANVLKYGLFSPKGLASKVRMMNPMTYVMANPMVRKEYLKAFLGVGAGWYTLLQLVKGAGALTGNKVQLSTDMNSSDFGKARIGNVRLDLGGGFQQPLILMHRFATGHVTSSATGRKFELGQGFRAPTRREMVQNFMVNKESPIAKFAYDMANASTHQPFHVADRVLQLYVPLIIGDMLDIAQEDPKLLPGIMPFVALGGGSQAYDRGESEGKFIPPKHDILFKGGGDMLPWH